MSYFTKFSKTPFERRELTDITRKFEIRKDIKNNPLAYDEYLIGEGETPEFVATQFYGEPKYNWIIFLMNDFLDPFYDWPLDSSELDEFVNEKYEDPQAVHHYEDSDGFIIHPSTVSNPEDYEVTNLEYEEQLNESKREIKLLKREFLNLIIL